MRTESYGAYIELTEAWNKPFSFFTTGQNVPEDYLEADKKYLAEKVLERWAKEIFC